MKIYQYNILRYRKDLPFLLMDGTISREVSPKNPPIAICIATHRNMLGGAPLFMALTESVGLFGKVGCSRLVFSNQGFTPLKNSALLPDFDYLGFFQGFETSSGCMPMVCLEHPYNLLGCGVEKYLSPLENHLPFLYTENGFINAKFYFDKRNGKKCNVNPLADMSGVMNTRNLIMQPSVAPIAAFSCHNYSRYRIYNLDKKFVTYLPSLGEMIRVVNNFPYINDVLMYLKVKMNDDGASQYPVMAECLKMDKYWTSTNYNNELVWYVDMQYGFISLKHVTEYAYVRPFITFK